MNITFAFTDTRIASAFSTAFGEDLPNVKFEHGCVGQVACNRNTDCIVTTANSFGRMDGGVDGTVNALMTGYEPGFCYFHERVQRMIASRFCGEQPVGTCMLVRTHHPTIPYVAHMPTMRVPEDVGQSLNAYLAFRSLLVEVTAHDNNDVQTKKISSLVCVPCCANSGCMPIERSARQMRAAYDSVFSVRPDVTSWPSLHVNHRTLKAL